MHDRLFCLLLFCFCLGSLNAQPHQEYIFSHLGTRDGLSSAEVMKVQQDAKGYIWIATINGLQRYDGQRFLSFYHDGNNPRSIPNNAVAAIQLDKKNRLWLLCGENKIGYMDVSDFTFHEVPVRLETEVLERAPSQLYMDNVGNIMLSLTQIAVLTYNEAANEFSIKHTPFHLPDGWRILRPFQDKYQGNYWMACDSGLAKYNPVRKTLSYRNHNVDKDDVIEALGSLPFVSLPYLDASKRFWIYSWPHNSSPALYSYDRVTKTKKEWEQQLYPALRSMYHEIHNISEDSDGRIWITGLNVFGKLDKTATRFEMITNNTAGEFSIRYDIAKNVVEDKEKNVWVSTDKGLFHFNPSAQVFEILTNHRPGIDTTYTPDVSDILQTKNGDLLVSTWGNGLFAYDHNFKPIKPGYITAGEKQNEGLNWCILQRSNGDIWRGSQDGWLFITPAGTNTTTSLHPPAFENTTIRQIAEDKKGDLWLGSHRGHLVKWDKATNTFLLVMKTSTIYNLFVDKKGDLWISTGGDGVYRINTGTGAIITHYTSKGPEGKRLMSLGSAAVAQYNDSIYAIASAGLNILNANTGAITFINADKGLPSNNVNNLIFDRKGFLWLTTDSRICRITIDRLVINIFNEEDGIPTSSFNVSSANTLTDGRIGIGRAHDLILFNPQILEGIDSLSVPAVEVTGLAVMNSWLSMDSIQKLPALKLRHNENSVTVEFSTLTYMNTFSVSYIMEGLDKNWTTRVRTNQAIYNYLPPGDYTFKVRCKNGEGRISQITEIKISVRAPFWKTWWFYSILALVAATLFYWEDKERIKRKVSVQVMRTNIASNLHEEINKALNNINMLSEIARIKADKEPEQSKAFINEIHHKSHNMIIAMDDVLWSIDPANDSMAKTIDRIKEFADSMRHRHEVLINLHTDEKVVSLKPDMKIRYEVMIIYKLGLRLLVEELKTPHTSINIDYIRSQLQLNIFAHHMKLPDNKNQVIKMIDEMKIRAGYISASLEFQSDEKGTAIILAVKV